MVRVAIIGGGSSGIAAAKVCLEYGYEIICYEKSQDLGGLWRYKSEECKGEASVMKSTVVLSSKEMNAFSDFPPPAEFANFMHNRQMLAYFRKYATNFNVIPHTKFNSDVQLVVRADDYPITGRWVVIVKDSDTGKSTTETFDGVLLCTGHHAQPYEPEFEGLQDGTFRGRVLHSHSYKEASDFSDQNVIVVGIGNSGADIAVELSRVAKQVYLVTRRGGWIWPRTFENGMPMDMVLNSHWFNSLAKIAPRFSQAIIERKLLQRCNSPLLGLTPSHHAFQTHPTINEELPCRILSGTVIVKPNIKKFIGQKECVFEDGTIAEDIDVVILCTGYVVGFPYLEPDIINVNENKVELYKYMYSPKLQHPHTLAVIGCVQPVGGLFLVSEMQARIFCEYLQPKPGRTLPSKDQMCQDISKKAVEKGRLVQSNRHTLEEPYIPLQYELAKMIDAVPFSSFYYLFKGDPKLAWALAVGPCTAYEFRLRGPHAWRGARDAIVSVWDRMQTPAKARKIPDHICGPDRSHGLDCVIKEYYSFIIGFILLIILLLVTVFIYR